MTVRCLECGERFTPESALKQGVLTGALEGFCPSCREYRPVEEAER